MIDQQGNQLATTSEDYERIKQRLTELMAILIESMQSDPQAQSMGLAAMGPVVILMIQNYETGKLHKLLVCLQEISRAVCNLDYSQDQYEETIVPWIKGLQEALS